MKGDGSSKPAVRLVKTQATARLTVWLRKREENDAMANPNQVSVVQSFFGTLRYRSQAFTRATPSCIFTMLDTLFDYLWDRGAQRRRVVMYGQMLLVG